MAPLSSELRRGLETTIAKAREDAEAAAKAALERLAVNTDRLPDYLRDEGDRQLRRELVARRRQLGSFERLVEACAYELWHRMLFARFLAENHLLMHPLHGVPVTLDECEELAGDEGLKNKWEVAARYASQMLPQIFRPDDPVLRVTLAPEKQHKLEKHVASLPSEAFTADDSLGWVYQYWQAKRKAEVNASEEKIDGDRIGPVTQLFTEPYMVDFLLQNTLGAWWVRRHGTPPPVEMPYLRTSPPGSSSPPTPLSRRSPGEGEEARSAGGGEEGTSARVRGVASRPLVAAARDLRQAQTPPEDLLWDRLRGRALGGLKFRRQHPIDEFVLDFYCDKPRLAVEVDGAQHAEQRDADAERDEVLRARGVRTLRIAARTVLQDLDGALRLIAEAAGCSSPPGPLSRRSPGEGEEARSAGGGEEGTSPPTPLSRRSPGEGEEAPSAGGGEAQWPERAAEITVMDPCCGSGHFLVAAFEILTAFRMAEEGLTAAEAGDAVLRDNLFGLEPDERCTQIAAFALASAAWKRGGYRALPPLNIACSGIAPRAKREEWLELAGEDRWLRTELDRLYDLFQNAGDLGSLINPTAVVGDGLFASRHRVQEALQRALGTSHPTPLSRRSPGEGEEARSAGGGEEEEAAVRSSLGVAAQGIAKAAELLSGHYTLVATNVPYLARGKQGKVLAEYCDRQHPKARNDLATCFLERNLALCAPGGTVAHVLPQNWTFLKSYTKLRQELLSRQTFLLLARLGENGFSSSQAAGAFTILAVLGADPPPEGHTFAALDASEPRDPQAKAAILRTGEMVMVPQAEQLRNPDARIGLEEGERARLLQAVASGYAGLQSGDAARFIRTFVEVDMVGRGWELQRTTVSVPEPYAGAERALLWEGGKGALWRAVCARLGERGTGAWLRGREAWGKEGVIVSSMRGLPVSLYLGELFDNNTAAIIPHDPAHLPAIWCFCSSPEFNEAVRAIDQSLKVTNATLVKVPFDLERWQRVAEERYPDGLPKPHSDDCTQWLFHGHPARAEAGQELHVAVARLLGYRWPRQQEGVEVRGCEPIGPDGLEGFADRDGVVCLVPLKGERGADERLRDLLVAAYGDEWNPDRVKKLIAATGSNKKTLAAWLRDDFFAQHCRLFQNRPFIWHLWDGRGDGFHCLVNYHRLDRALLERIAYSYLDDWIRGLKDAQEHGEEGAEARLLAAQDLQSRLKLILEGEKPYDIFVRWKPLEEQPIGWEPDLNDGVRLNIRPFVTADVLRRRPNINWNKDRGKEPPGVPGGPDRVNDRHLTLEEKRAARARRQAGDG